MAIAATSGRRYSSLFGKPLLEGSAGGGGDDDKHKSRIYLDGLLRYTDAETLPITITFTTTIAPAVQFYRER